MGFRSSNAISRAGQMSRSTRLVHLDRISPRIYEYLTFVCALVSIVLCKFCATASLLIGNGVAGIIIGLYSGNPLQPGDRVTYNNGIDDSTGRPVATCVQGGTGVPQMKGGIS